MSKRVAEESQAHARWVRVTHWVLTISLLTLAVSGYAILMVHPRLYWGEVGNDLVPALLELPISRNHQHGGWTEPVPFSGSTESAPATAEAPVSASRTFAIFNQNSWGRSLHFLAAWLLVIPGAAYLWLGLTRGHFRLHFLPRRGELSPARFLRDVVDHLRFRVHPRAGPQHYGLLQKISYAVVIFVLGPVIVVSGLAMSPAVTAALPFLLDVFGGFQSARTIHFFAFVALVLFVAIHVLMVIRSGFVRQMKAMITGRST